MIKSPRYFIILWCLLSTFYFAAILCTRCQKPLLDDTKIELSNLGLRTAGDGETVSSSQWGQIPNS